MAQVSDNFIIDFNRWANAKTYDLSYSMPRHEIFKESVVPQERVFAFDVTRLIKTVPNGIKYEIGKLFIDFAALTTVPLAPFIDIYRGAPVGNNARLIPAVFHKAENVITWPFKAAYKAISVPARAVGIISWHLGEWIARQISGSSETVLSNDSKIRDIVYESTGLTLIGLCGAFSSNSRIALAALPIIFGSLYGTINNQFTVRNCPEYYTMGHHYDGTSLRHHAIKTNNLIIKPIVTGCYATTVVTPWAGLVFSLVGTPVVPVATAARAIVAISCASLLAGHIVAEKKKASIQANLAEYAKRMGFMWTDELKRQTWYEVKHLMKEKIPNGEVDTLIKAIEEEIEPSDLPVNYIADWASNSARNGIGYLAAAVGTLAMSIGALFLRRMG